MILDQQTQKQLNSLFRTSYPELVEHATHVHGFQSLRGVRSAMPGNSIVQAHFVKDVVNPRLKFGSWNMWKRLEKITGFASGSLQPCR